MTRMGLTGKPRKACMGICHAKVREPVCLHEVDKAIRYCRHLLREPQMV